MDNSAEIFIRNLKRLRKVKFPKQEDFAPIVNFSTRGYQKYETGESSPTPEILDRFAKALGCEPVDLITPEGQGPEEKEVLTLSDLANKDAEILEAIRGLQKTSELELPTKEPENFKVLLECWDKADEESRAGALAFVTSAAQHPNRKTYTKRWNRIAGKPENEPLRAPRPQALRKKKPS
jgi:transcriptional regulator with XRE-family HTH domain